jgi:hypothetical protein
MMCLTRFEAHREAKYAELSWDLRSEPALRWRVLRSEREFAETADALVGGDQTLVSESTEPGAHDDAVAAGTTYFYTVFSQDERGAWQRQVMVTLGNGDHLRWHHPDDMDFMHAGPSDGYLDAHAVQARELYMARRIRSMTGHWGDESLQIGLPSGEIYAPDTRHLPEDD